MSAIRTLLTTVVLCFWALAPAEMPAQVVPAVAPTSDQIQAAARPSTDQTWWKHAFIYEIYPRSFQDSNGDGVGDLNGITQRLDYLKTIGVDTIWIAPMYPSPQVDFGYDISDYEAVDPQYGTLADFDRLEKAAQQHGIRIVLDMVLNHTSDKHSWFVDSASSRTNPKANWYVWNDGVLASSAGVTEYQKRYEHDGMVPPNNWVSLFGGSAWEWSPVRKQFYYHKFYKQQPDLNWRNPAVEKAMFDTMRFWLDKGVAGFRLDAIPTLFEDEQLRSERTFRDGVNAQGDPNLNDEYTNMLPEVHDVLRRMRRMVDTYPGNRVLIGETYLPNTSELLKWYGGEAGSLPELQLPMDLLVGFHTEGGAGSSPNISLNVDHFRQFVGEVETQIGTNWPLLVFDNHDNPRSWDRFTTAEETPEQKKQIAKIVATVLFTTRASAMSYYGAELGMVTSTPTRREDVRDPIGITGWPNEKGRDGERTPMQWTPGPQAGFSSNPRTWLPVAVNYPTVNVQTESADPASLLNWTIQLTALRKTNAALRNGGFVLLDVGPAVISYVRTAPSGATPVLTALNFSGVPQTVTFDLSAAHLKSDSARTLLSSDPSFNGTKILKSVTLPPYASWIATLQ